MTQNHSGFFFLTTILLRSCCPLGYSKFVPTCTRNRGFPPKTWPMHATMPAAFCSLHQLDARARRGAQKGGMGAVTDPGRSPPSPHPSCSWAEPPPCSPCLQTRLMFVFLQEAQVPGTEALLCTHRCDLWPAAQRSPFRAIYTPVLRAALPTLHAAADVG